MPKHLTGIDHCVILVRDLDAAAATYRKLGFTLSPRGFHSAHMGSANHTLMLQDDYFELLGIISPTDHNKKWRNHLDQNGEGLTAIALATDDADKACHEIRDMGMTATDPIAFSRPVDLPGGGKAEAAFRVTQLPPGSFAGAEVFVCGHLTRQNVWLPVLQDHANTAQGLAAVIMAAADPERAAQAWTRVFGKAAVSPIEGGLAVKIGKTPLEIITPTRATERYVGVAPGRLERDRLLGLAFRVRDLAKARASIDMGIRTVKIGDSVIVAPREACGTLIEFGA
ncbi:MAG: VOC family protein [Alphaproteobacteria bacterium]|nr:VOC family protein [Alphaproteobacteria bacterium]